jgi:hypothetical protein
MPRKVKGIMKRNELTPNPNDFIVTVETSGNYSPKEIIAELSKEGMEIKQETALDIVTRYNRKSVELATGGSNVNTGLVHLRLTVKGAFFDKTWDPKRNSVAMSVVPGAAIRAALSDVVIDITGEQADQISIFGVLDPAAEPDEQRTLTRGFGAEMKGTLIKITGEGEYENKCGLYFRNVDTDVETKIEKRYITTNDPSRIVTIIPATLDAGMYEIRITTQYAGSKPLKEPRSATLPHYVEIK